MKADQGWAVCTLASTLMHTSPERLDFSTEKTDPIRQGCKRRGIQNRYHCFLVRTVVITYKYIFYLIQETQWESGSIFLNYLTVTRRRLTTLCHLGPSFRNLSHGDCMFTYDSKENQRKAYKKEMHPHLLCLLSEGGRALDPLSLGSPW